MITKHEQQQKQKKKRQGKGQQSRWWCFEAVVAAVTVTGVFLVVATAKLDDNAAVELVAAAKRQLTQRRDRDNLDDIRTSPLQEAAEFLTIGNQRSQRNKQKLDGRANQEEKEQQVEFN